MCSLLCHRDQKEADTKRRATKAVVVPGQGEQVDPELVEEALSPKVGDVLLPESVLRY